MSVALVSPILASVKAPKGSHIAPDRLAKRLNMTLAELARLARVHRNTLGRAPASPDVQRSLSAIVAILDRAANIASGDENLAVYWFRYQLLPAFDKETAADLVRQGYGDAVMEVLDMVEDGVPA